MKKKIINNIVNILEEKGFVNFYLHNETYTIMKDKDEFIIKQSGCDNIHKFKNITDLFQYYYVYGESLIESLEDIII